MRNYGLLDEQEARSTHKCNGVVVEAYAVLDLDGRQYLVNAGIRDAVPAHGRPPGRYAWIRQSKANGAIYKDGKFSHDGPLHRKRAKLLARLIRSRLDEIARAA